VPRAKASRLALLKNSGPQSVVILEGIAGLVAAWELKKAGYAAPSESFAIESAPQLDVFAAALASKDDGMTETFQFADGNYFNAVPHVCPPASCDLGSVREFGVPSKSK